MKEKILIVDDSEDIRILLKRILVSAGHDVFEAASGDDAISLAGEVKPDLVLLDIVMPGIDGYGVCEALKQRYPSMDMPVIFLSAKTDAADRVRGLEIGGSDYITKPFDKAEVLARVENHLKIRRLTGELIRTNKELTDKQRALDEDLKAAAGIQRSLMPREIPNIKNLSVAWKFMPSHMIGGDIFNIFRLDENHFGLYMVDVSGHGVQSALVTVSVSQMLQPDSGIATKRKTETPPGYQIVPPRSVLETLDAEYPLERFDKYFTIVYMVIDTASGALAYSNAAHPSPVVLRYDGTIELLDKGGTIIGLGGLVPFEEGRKTLKAGDRVVLYTDGVVEYRNKEGEFFGEERFYAILASLRQAPINDMLDGILASMNDFGMGKEYQDDITLIALEYGSKKE